MSQIDDMKENEKLNSENSAIVVATGAWFTERTNGIPLNLELVNAFAEILQRYIDQIEKLEAKLSNFEIEKSKAK